MNSNILIVGLVAVAAGLGLLLLLAPAQPVAAPEGGDVAVVTQVVEEVTEAATEIPGAAYWKPVGHGTASSAVATTRTASYAPPCASCGTVHAVPVAVAPTIAREVRLVGGCGAPVSPCDKPDCFVCRRAVTPCGRPDCPTCQRAVSPCNQAVARTGGCGHLDTCMGACGHPATPCAEPACAWPAPCQPTCDRGCERTCPVTCPERPGINHNLPTCFDECSMVQLHSTARQPICSVMRFEWAASKGSFLNPDSSDPLYFTPTVYMPGGEDVWITLTITDQNGVRYTDEIKIHVRNNR